MHLKHMEVVGFKSFSDKVKLNFEKGITAIVGPNGCGKSNIIDAIRWCLGETSAKSLRSSQMMDVIFNGSGSRPPQHMAEVVLTFDNSDKRLPIDYTDVSISRRLFRSGESEYYINKTQCRLRDIRELFLDTGMGEDGYSSMEQGKVEWVLNAKPEQRRELFEEAAGVSKYRARREEAVRKLEKVDVDLSRIFDILTVTKDQIKKLETAVNRAQTYQRIKEELKVMEVGDWLHQLATIKTDLQQIETQLLESQKAAEELNTEIHVQDSDISTHRLSLTKIEEELLTANTRLAAIDADIKIAQERIQNFAQREQELTRQSENILSNINREKGRIEELTVQQANQQKTLDESTASGSSLEEEFENSKKIFSERNQVLEEKKNLIKVARDLIMERAQERARLQQQMGSVASEAVRLESQLQNAEKEKEKVQAELAQVQSLKQRDENEISELKSQFEQKEDTVKQTMEEINTLNRQEDMLGKNRTEVLEKIARLNGQIHSIEAQQNLDPYLSGAQTVMAMNIPGVYGPISRLYDCSDLDRDMIVSAIGEHLGDLVADSSDIAEEALRNLAAQEKGRARIWILNKIPQGTMTDAGGEFGRDELSRRIKSDEKFHPLFQLLTSDVLVQGDYLYGNAFINGGAAPSKWKSHTPLRLPELEKELAQNETKRVELDEEIKQTTLKLAAFQDTLQNVVKDRNDLRVRVEVKESELRKSAQNVGMLNEELHLLASETVQLKNNQESSQVRLQEFQKTFDELQNKEKTDHEELDRLHQELPELQQTHANANADLASKSEKLRAYQERLNWQASILEHTKNEIEAIRQSISSHEQTRAHLIDEVENAKKGQQDAKQLVESSMGLRSEAQERVSAIQIDRTSLIEKVSQLTESLTALRSKHTALSENIQNNKIQETTLKSRVESIFQRLQDQYEMNEEAALAQFQPQAGELEVIEKLKRRIANIGPINLAAPQEHQELSEKLTFLSTQHDDLVKAKDDLKLVISKINATTKEHFRETFDKVRENFRTLYAMVFRGGEADLRLTDENDILNAGIDIYCTPPGKKVMHITLLSGGEKALTACALLFAFFQVRPSPVALLDEVDAPLDEANVLRFVDLIKLFSEKSQFFMISHNKRTMEAANTLYGVTMEELGISKVLSAHLAKDKKKIEQSLDNQEKKEEQAASV